MGYTRPRKTTKDYLVAAPLPNHGKTYTVIPHKDVIETTKTLLDNSGFQITKELYRANMNAKVAQGVYHLASDQDEEMGMMFAWTNSYDKSTRFQCAVGAFVNVCSNGMLCGDMANYARKHTGKADHDIHTQISSQIKSANKYYTKLIDDKNEMRKIFLPKKDQAELVGRLFLDEEIIDSSQVSCIKAEMKEPSYDYKADLNNAWTFYNHITHALKKSHPRTWMSDQVKFHEFMTAELLSQAALKKQDTSWPVDFIADMEAQEYDTFEEFKI
jgi:hypothetical protein|tara:strand:- start:971 stop:1786 length:816 start_codon:yes stop_codon:yes gene_type:complete